MLGPNQERFLGHSIRMFCYHAGPSTMTIRARLSILAIFAAFVAGCFYPPITAPPTDEQQQTIIPLPYDLAWQVVNKVIADNGFRIQAQESNEGIIETVAPRFTPARRRLRQDKKRRRYLRGGTGAERVDGVHLRRSSAGQGIEHRASTRDVQFAGQGAAASGDRRRLRVARNPGGEPAAAGFGGGQADSSPGLRKAGRRQRRSRFKFGHAGCKFKCFTAGGDGVRALAAKQIDHRKIPRKTGGESRTDEIFARAVGRDAETSDAVGHTRDARLAAKAFTAR